MVIVGGGLNGLVCASYLVTAGLSVVVVERSSELGGSVHTVQGTAGRFEVGAFEVGALIGSGVAADLELMSRWGLRLIPREVMVAALEPGEPPLVFHRDLDATVDGIGTIVGGDAAADYRSFAAMARAVLRLMSVVESAAPPSLGVVDLIASVGMGAAGRQLMRTVLASASEVLRGTFDDDRLCGALGQFAALAGLDPALPGTGLGALRLAALHGAGGARPVGGTVAVIDALARSITERGGVIATGTGVERIELRGGRAARVWVDGRALVARHGVVCTIDAGRVFGGLLAARDVPDRIRAELRMTHSGAGNVSEVKVDVIARAAGVTELGVLRQAMLVGGGLRGLERAFAHVRLGRVAADVPVVVAVPSAFEPGWAADGQHSLWVQAVAPWLPDAGAWSPELTRHLTDTVLGAAGRLVGALEVVEARTTGPADWSRHLGAAAGNPNHLDLTLDQLLALRPTPSLARYRTPIPGLFLSGAGTHPGGGMSGAAGRNAARAVIRSAGVGGPGRLARLMRQRVMLCRDAVAAMRQLRAAR